MHGSFPTHEGDRTACMEQMALALKVAPFQFVATSSLSYNLVNYVTPHNLAMSFSLLPDQTTNSSLSGFMNMNSIFMNVFRADEHLVYLQWDKFSATERIGFYSDWFRKALCKVLFLWLTDM